MSSVPVRDGVVDSPGMEAGERPKGGVYRPRNPRASALYQCVDRHGEELRAAGAIPARSRNTCSNATAASATFTGASRGFVANAAGGIICSHSAVRPGFVPLVTKGACSYTHSGSRSMRVS